MTRTEAEMAAHMADAKRVYCSLVPSQWENIGIIAANLAAARAQGRREGIEEALRIIGECCQALAEIRHPTERQMGAFDAVSAIEDEVLSCTAALAAPEPQK